MRWTVGEVAITSIWEQELHGLGMLIPSASPENVQRIPWLAPHFADVQGQMNGVIQAFVIETPQRTIVVDTCVGDQKERRVVPTWNGAETGFLPRFTAAGFDPAAIDLVLCTHLHVDHVGWNTFWTGTEWRPTFPSARHLIVDVEMDHWESERARPVVDPSTLEDPLALATALFGLDQRSAHEDSVRPLLAAGRVDGVSSHHRVCEEVSLFPTPGHTPGHVSVWIRSKGEEAVITGDCIHHPCQIAHPEWTTLADTQPEVGIASRRALLERVAGTRVLLVGSHVAAAGHVEADGASFRLVAVGDARGEDGM